MERLLYFTELLGLKVYDLRKRAIGRVRDCALAPPIHPVRIDRYLVGGGSGLAFLTVRHDQIQSISLDGIFLRDEQLTPYHASSDEYVLRIERDLLDQQIIDAQGRKVVRVNDVTFEIRDNFGRDELAILEVDIGVRSIFRRLAQGVIPRQAIRRAQRRIEPNSIPWNLCNIVEPDPQRRLRLNISHDLLEQMHPADLADIVEELSPEDREAIFEAIDEEVAAEALSEIEPEIQAQIIESLETERAADILEEMAPDEAADVLAELEEEMSEEILEEMEGETKDEVEELLEYEEDTAGGMMTPQYVAVHEDASVADALEAVRSQPDLRDALNTMFVTDIDGRLKGAFPLARVLFAKEDAGVSELLPEEQPLFVNVHESNDRVVEIFDKYNLMTLPVIDEEGRLAGVVTADDVISVLRQK
jgi:CBS domain-containing protein